MKKKVLIIGRGVAGKRYKEIIVRKFPELEVYTYDRNNKVQFHDFIIVASSTNNHYRDTMASIGNCERILVEKPLVTNLLELKKVDDYIHNQEIDIFTGDQFYHSKALDDLKRFIEKEKEKFKLEITYSDALNNVTKGKFDSYFYDLMSGGVLYTFSHAYFAFEFLLNGIEKSLLSTQKRYLAAKPGVMSFVISKWLVKDQSEVRVSTDVMSNELKFEICYQSSNSSIFIDLIKGEVKTEGKEVLLPQQSRLDLIENNIVSFLTDTQTDQFAISKSAMNKIWMVMNWE